MKAKSRTFAISFITKNTATVIQSFKSFSSHFLVQSGKNTRNNSTKKTAKIIPKKSFAYLCRLYRVAEYESP